MTITLCDRFPAYTPTDIRKEKSHEIFLLISRFNKHSIKKEQPKVIRKKAGNDWF